ncbi:MAG TPA: glycine cleavage system protein GcvH [Tepidisphaeraceae bacterium]|nr:glycine cleavage system protein GcvH [Tepidisphaeraceae bacterium]
MADAPKDYRYLQSHEWHRQELDGTITVGITQIAADELTDVTYVALPAVGTTVARNQRWGEIESVKATSDLYAGVSGTVSAVNDDLANNPGLVNTDPYVGGWMIKIQPSNPAEFAQLLSADAYLEKAG